MKKSKRILNHYQIEILNKYSNMVSTEFVKNFPSDHKTWFNNEKVIKMLKLAGFKV